MSALRATTLTRVDAHRVVDMKMTRPMAWRRKDITIFISCLYNGSDFFKWSKSFIAKTWSQNFTIKIIKDL